MEALLFISCCCLAEKSPGAALRPCRVQDRRGQLRQGYPRLSSLIKIAHSWLLNAQIALTVIWISSWKLYFSSAAAAWLRSRRALHCALAGCRIAGASFCTLTGLRRGRLVCWAGTILPGCWRRSSWCWLRLRSLVEPISFDEAPPAGLVRTKHRCTHQAHDVAIEVAQHFEKIDVKSVFCEVWFCDVLHQSPMPTLLSSVIPEYVCKNLHNMGCPNKTWDNPDLMPYPDISWIILKLNKNR